MKSTWRRLFAAAAVGALDVLVSLGLDATRGVNSSSDAKRAKGFEPSTFSLGS